MRNNYFSKLILNLFLVISCASNVIAQTTPVPAPEAAAGTWQCIRGSQRLQGTQYMKGGFGNTPVLKWKAQLQSTKGGCEGEPVIGDVNGDGKNDVVVTAHYGSSNYITAFDGATGTKIWETPGVSGMTSPAIGDANGDGKMDVAVAGDKVYLLSGDSGLVIWSFAAVVPNGGNIDTSPNMGDLDSDGYVEVVVIVDDAVYAINGINGTQKWKYATTRPTATQYNGSTPAIGDVNGDGILDVVAALQNGAYSRLAALNGNNGTLIWGHAVNVLAGFINGVPAIGDVDGDCNLDVVYNQAILRGSNGSVIWGDPTTSFNALWGIISDLDDDCNVEVITERGVYKGKDGSVIWANPNGSNGWFAPAPRVGDFNPSSPGKEIVTASSYQVRDSSGIWVPNLNATPIRMLEGMTGTILWSYDIATLFGHSVEGVSIGDIDNDGCVEIVIAPDCCFGDNTLLALDDSGNTANCGILASIGQVDFTYDSVSCQCFSFNDFSSSCANSWNWSFPGGTPSTSTAKNPGVVCYNSSGTYSATMIAKLNACAANDTVVHSVIINPILPIANFNSSDTVFCNEAGECIDFFDLSTNNPIGWQWLFPGALPDTSSQQNPVNICYYTPGSYSVTLIATNSCGGTDTLAVNPLIIFGQTPPAPTLTVIGGDTIICSHASSYQWYFNGVPIPGATDSFYVAPQPGNYNVYITDDIGCTRLGNGVTVSSVHNVTGMSGIQIFPNPAKDEITIKGIALHNSMIMICNVLGETLYQAKNKLSDHIVMNIKSFPAGMYYISIKADKGILIKKFVKE